MLVLMLVLGGYLVSKSYHELVPVHEVMNEKDTKKLLEDKTIAAENLPKILSSDPQAVRIEAKAGTVIKISRKSKGKEYNYYRFVVEG